MNILKFRMLVLIERYKKATTVAEQMGMKQPTISFHMKKMEEEWGIKLFEYKAGKIILTEAARLIHHYAQRIVASHDEAWARVQEMSGHGRGSLTIGCTDTVLSALPNAPWVADLPIKDKPIYHVRTGEHDALMGMLGQGRLDLVLSGQGPQESGQSQQVLESPLALVVSDSHPLLHLEGDPAGMHLTAYPYLRLEDRSVTEAVMVWEAEQGISLKAHLHADRSSLLFQSLRRGHSFTIVPAAAIPPDEPGIQRLPLPGRAPQWKIQVFTPKQHWNLSLLSQTVERLLQS